MSGSASAPVPPQAPAGSRPSEPQPRPQTLDEPPPEQQPTQPAPSRSILDNDDFGYLFLVDDKEARRKRYEFLQSEINPLAYNSNHRGSAFDNADVNRG